MIDSWKSSLSDNLITAQGINWLKHNLKSCKHTGEAPVRGSTRMQPKAQDWVVHSFLSSIKKPYFKAHQLG